MKWLDHANSFTYTNFFCYSMMKILLNETNNRKLFLDETDIDKSLYFTTARINEIPP